MSGRRVSRAELWASHDRLCDEHDAAEAAVTVIAGLAGKPATWTVLYDAVKSGDLSDYERRLLIEVLMGMSRAGLLRLRT